MILENTQVLNFPSFEKPFHGYLAEVTTGSYKKIEGQMIIGRSPHCDFILHDPHASLQHCRIERRAAGFFVCDLQSKNGTWVNGIRMTEAEIINGSRIQVGKTGFVFETKEPDQNRPNLPISSRDLIWGATLRQMPNIANSNLPVFIQGESGTGKEVVAKLLHDLSERSEGPFISVNCSALTETLVESELFGHIKGSFTGATGDRKGAFESARGGSLFLDEIGDLPLSLQPKLLRALENREIRPVGSDKVIGTDVRVITATHKPLEKLVAQSMFRADLYFRIHVLKLGIPALRDRKADFDDLLYTFCKEHRVRFSVAAIEAMKSHTWPGNIRELKNVVARASALFPQTYIQPEHVAQLLDRPLHDQQNKEETGDFFSRIESAVDGGTPVLKSIERELIKTRLVANKGNQRRTAAELGIPKSTLHDRIKHYQIDLKSLLIGNVFEKDPPHTTGVQDAVDAGR